MWSLKQCSFWRRNFSGLPRLFWSQACPRMLSPPMHPLGRGVSTRRHHVKNVDRSYKSIWQNLRFRGKNSLCLFFILFYLFLVLRIIRLCTYIANSDFSVIYTNVWYISGPSMWTSRRQLTYHRRVKSVNIDMTLTWHWHDMTWHDIDMALALTCNKVHIKGKYSVIMMHRIMPQWREGVG